MRSEPISCCLALKLFLNCKIAFSTTSFIFILYYNLHFQPHDRQAISNKVILFYFLCFWSLKLNVENLFVPAESKSMNQIEKNFVNGTQLPY